MLSKKSVTHKEQGKIAKKNLKIPIRLNDFYALHTDVIFENMIKAMDEVKWEKTDTSDDIKRYITDAFLKTIEKNKEKREADEINFMKEVINITADIIIGDSFENKSRQTRTIFAYKEKLKKKLKTDVLNFFNQNNPNLPGAGIECKLKMLGFTMKDANLILLLHPKPEKISSDFLTKLIYQTTTIRSIRNAIAMMQGYYEDSPHGFGLKDKYKLEKMSELNKLGESAFQIKAIFYDKHSLGANISSINELIKLVIDKFNIWCEGKKNKREEIIKKLDDTSEHHLARMYAVFLSYLRNANLINKDLEEEIKIKINFTNFQKKLYPDLIELFDEITQFEKEDKKNQVPIPVNPTTKAVIKMMKKTPLLDREDVKAVQLEKTINHNNEETIPRIVFPQKNSSIKDSKTIITPRIFSNSNEVLEECNKLKKAVGNITLNADEINDEPIETTLFTLKTELLDQNLKRKNPNISSIDELGLIKKLIDTAIIGLPNDSDLKKNLESLIDSNVSLTIRPKL